MTVTPWYDILNRAEPGFRPASSGPSETKQPRPPSPRCSAERRLGHAQSRAVPCDGAETD